MEDQTASAKRNRRPTVVLLMVMWVLLASCASTQSSGEGAASNLESTASEVVDTDAENADAEDADVIDGSEEVLVVEGVTYTCGEIVGADDCGAMTKTAFARYKENIMTFVNSGTLGPLNDGSFEDAAYAGLVACVYLDDGKTETEFIDFMLNDPSFEAMDRTAMLPAWFEAQTSLCPGGSGPQTSLGGTDKETP